MVQKSKEGVSLSSNSTKKVDPVLFIITAAIFVVLLLTSYLVLSIMSMTVMIAGGLILFYYLSKTKSSNKFSEDNKKRKLSLFSFFLLIVPFIFGAVISYEGISMGMSALRVVIIWGFTVNFWCILLFVPMAVYSKNKEQVPHSPILPFVSIIVPAYNEEKVIEKTIKSLLELSPLNPIKEIIVVDDGSEDRTLEIAKIYQESITVLEKKHGGKAAALNFGIKHANGDVMVIVDADTILDKNALSSLVIGFTTNSKLGAAGGNIKIRNKVNWITWCQTLEYIAGINIIRRAFDIFGTINMVPGALGAFKKSALFEVNEFSDETVVEDFDATIKIIKKGYTAQASNKAIAYTEAPQSLRDLYLQRKRWYRGNLQVLTKHFDVLSNPQSGYLYNLIFPFLLISMIVLPSVGMLVLAVSIIAILTGDALFVLNIFLLFVILQHLQTALAVRIDRDDPKIIAFSLFAVIGYKQIIDFLLIKASFEELLRRKAIWTSAKRIGG